MSFTAKGKMTVAGHRGDCYNYFENTMTAFKGAIEAGAEMIETDIHLSLDNELVLIHDDTVNRTTNGKGRVSEMTLAQLRELNAGNLSAPEQIPTLAELLELVKDTEITLNLEIKEYYSSENEARSALCIDKTLDLIEKYGMGSRCLVNSFDAWVLEYVYKKHGKKYALHGFYPYYELRNVTINPDEYLYCACIFDNENKAHYDYLKEHGIEAWVGASITQKARLKLCYEYGASLITTNNPADIKQKLKELENECR